MVARIWERKSAIGGASFFFSYRLWLPELNAFEKEHSNVEKSTHTHTGLVLKMFVCWVCCQTNNQIFRFLDWFFDFILVLVLLYRFFFGFYCRLTLSSLLSSLLFVWFCYSFSNQRNRDRNIQRTKSSYWWKWDLNCSNS